MARIIEITDFHIPQLDIYARLSEVQLLRFYEPDRGIFIAESPKVIARALDAGCEALSCLVERKHIDGEAREILSRIGDVPVYTADHTVLTQLTGFALTRGMLCANVDRFCPPSRPSAPMLIGSPFWKMWSIPPTWGPSSALPPLWAWTPSC